ncbi:MAG: hypothetical protein RL385_815 [Pseudomonadota bacterium]|jgi:hypothetical protein
MANLRSGQSAVRAPTYLWLLACVAALVASTVVRAELPSGPDTLRDPELRAREAFQQGVAYASQRNYARAVQEFELALALRPATSVRYNLAAALFELGRFPEAHGHLARVLAAPDLSVPIFNGAQDLSLALAPNLALLTVDVSAAGAPEAVLRIDGYAVDARVWGRPVALEPGEHVVELSAAQRTLVQKHVELTLGRTTDVSLHVIALQTPGPLPVTGARRPSAQRSAPPVALPQADGHDQPRPLWMRWKAVSTLAAVVAVGAGVGLGIALAHRGESAPKDDVEPVGPGVLSW